MGLPVFIQSPNDAVPENEVLRHKNQTVYAVPLLVDFSKLEAEGDNIVITKVYCGAKHTVVRTRDGRIFVTGSNSFNQLGMLTNNETFKCHTGKVKSDVFIDEFKELKVDWNVNDFDIYCSNSCTIFIENK